MFYVYPITCYILLLSYFVDLLFIWTDIFSSALAVAEINLASYEEQDEEEEAETPSDYQSAAVPAEIQWGDSPLWTAPLQNNKGVCVCVRVCSMKFDM